MENLINKTTFNSTATGGLFASILANVAASFDRLEAAIAMAQACNAGQPINMTDMQSLGLRDL